MYVLILMYIRHDTQIDTLQGKGQTKKLDIWRAHMYFDGCEKECVHVCMYTHFAGEIPDWEAEYIYIYIYVYMQLYICR